MYQDVWIPMPDGVSLSARIWRPAGGKASPALFEFIPYRLEDFSAGRDASQHHYFAGHGLASVRVDLRGTGSSGGVSLGEYLVQEQDDAVAVIAWIANQPWCDGNVGMFGISWGGFNALQVAARRPPALKAIIAVAATDDRYSDDVHYLGGCVLGSEMLAWSATMLGYNSRPPGPRHGEDWKQKWLERLEATPAYIVDWLGHQSRDDFWKNGSVNEDYSAIQCPVFIIGGQADGYINAVFRLAENLSVPVRALLGPWAHAYPEIATPGPAVGFLQAALDWWGEWLVDEPPKASGGARMEAWVQDYVEPAPDYDHRPGRWVGLDQWPAPDTVINPTTFGLTGGELREAPAGGRDAEPEEHTIVGAQTHGLRSGGWWTLTGSPDKPLDQRVEDDLAMTFDGEPAAEAIDVIGRPEALLRVRADQEAALVAVRLCDVAPDGTSLLISRTVLNLTHRNGSEFPEPVVPGEWMWVSIRLDGVAHRLAPGHRFRLAVSNTLWPLAWPSPKVSTLGVDAANSTLELPVYLGAENGSSPVEFGPAEKAPTGTSVVEPDEETRTISHDPTSGVTTLVHDSFDGVMRNSDFEVTYSASSLDRYEIVEGDPLSARATCLRSITMEWAEASIGIETQSAMWADLDNWYVTNSLVASDAGEVVFERSDSFEIPRHFN